MSRLHPNDICDYLASRADADFKSVKFKGCLFNCATDELISTFLYEEGIKGKISGMKAQLEQEFKAAVTESLRAHAKQSLQDPPITFLFLYKQCYMDAGRLELLVTEFLRKNFSFLTLDLDDSDIAVTKGEGGFTAKLNLPKQTSDYIRGSKAFKAFVHDLAENNFVLFNFEFVEKPSCDQEELSLEDIEKFAESKLAANTKDRVDKVLRITNREYLLGTPIKERPIKIEFLRVCPQEQIIAGAISYLTKREYRHRKKYTNELGEEVTVEKPMPYWTFVLDDGARKQSCVYFPSHRTDETLKKNVEKMQTLADGETICVIGINDERNGRVNFSVRGISTCAF